jgi:hypothetical protein
LEQWPVEQSGPLAVISKVHSGLDARHREGPKIAADRQLHMIQFPPADESDLLDRRRFRTPGGGYPIAVGGGGRAIVEDTDRTAQSDDQWYGRKMLMGRNKAAFITTR